MDHFSWQRKLSVCLACALQIVLYLTRQLSNPLRIYLTPRYKPSQMIAEQVETDSLVKSVKGLLESRCLATSFSPNSRVFAKRQDGTTIQISINASEALGAVQTRISRQEVSWQVTEF